MKFGVFKFIYLICAFALGEWLYDTHPSMGGVEYHTTLNLVAPALFLTILTELYDVRPKSDLSRNRSGRCACDPAVRLKDMEE